MTEQQPGLSAFQHMVPHSLDRIALTAGAVTCSLLIAAGSFVSGVAYGKNTERQEQCYQWGMALAQELGEGEVLKRLGAVSYNQTFPEAVREKCNDDSNRWR